jgi:type IV secretion system protein VirB1
VLIAILTLAQLLTSCGLNTGVRTMSAIVTVESHGNPNAIHDNTTGRSYFPESTGDAIALANGLVSAGHSVDLGIAQINSGNLPGLGLTVASMFDPCVNVRAGAAILSGDYSRALQRFGRGSYAALRAVGAYNTGKLTEGDPYIRKVLDAYIPGPPSPPPRITVLVRTSPRHPSPVPHVVVAKKRPKSVEPAQASVLVPLGGMQPR